MANANGQVAAIFADAQEALRLVEQSQAVAARCVQRWTSLGSANSIDGADLAPYNVTEPEVEAAIFAFATHFPAILAAYAASLYKMRS